MEAKLAAHRAKKHRQEVFRKYKNLLLNMIPFAGQNNQSNNKKDDDDDANKNGNEIINVST